MKNQQHDNLKRLLQELKQPVDQQPKELLAHVNQITTHIFDLLPEDFNDDKYDSTRDLVMRNLETQVQQLEHHRSNLCQTMNRLLSRNINKFVFEQIYPATHWFLQEYHNDPEKHQKTYNELKDLMLKECDIIIVVPGKEKREHDADIALIKALFA